MRWSVFEFYSLLPAFLLVMFRVGGLMFATPLLNSLAVPRGVKLLLTAAMALAVFPMTVPHLPTTLTLASAVGGLFGELVIGVFMGFCVSLVFLGVQLAAEIVGQQSGLGLGAVFNPMLETSSAEVVQFYYLVAVMVFLAAGGDHALIRTLLDSFTAVPPLAFTVTEDLVSLLTDMLSISFALAIRVGGPMILALLLAFLVLGFISRTVPQLNILTVGFPLKLVAALAVMALTIVSMESVLADGFASCMEKIRLALGMDNVG